MSNFSTEDSFVDLFSSIDMNCEITGAVQTVGNSTYSSRTKHIAMEFLFLRELIKEGKIKAHHVSTHENLADICTKHVSKGTSCDIPHNIQKFE